MNSALSNPSIENSHSRAVFDCPGLSVSGLSVAFRRFSLQDISFSLPGGSVTALLGHNGAGKTTTLRLIMGLMRKDSGTVLLDESIPHEDEIAFKHRVGFVPEEGYFYGRMTIAQIITFVAPFYRQWNQERCMRLVRDLNLDLDRKISELSKGTRMKLSFLLAFSHDPDILLADEPTSGLDPRSRAEVIQLMQRAAHDEGRAVLFSTHNLQEVETIADRIIIVNRGQVLVQNDLEQLRLDHAHDPEWTLQTYYFEKVK